MSATGSHRRTLWLTGVVHAFTHLYQVALVPLYLRIQKDLELAGVEEATLLVTVMGVAYFLPSYPMGWLADRMSRRKLLGVGLLINGLGFVLLAMARGYGWALASVVLAGIGGSFYHPAATALIARLFPVGTGRAFGLVGIGASAGFFLGPIYAGWRAVVTGDWRAPVLELGVLGIVVAVVFLKLAEDQPAAASPVGHVGDGIQTPRGGDVPLTSGARSAATATRAGTARGADTLASRLWLLITAAALAFSFRDFAGAGNGSLTSLFLQKAHGFDPKEAGMALAAVFVASAISNPLFGGLSDRGRLRWLTMVLAISAALLVALPRLGPEWSVPVLAVYGFFFMSSFPMTEAALMESVPDAVRGRVFGFFITVSGLLSNQAHWAAGHWVEGMGSEAGVPSRYYGCYTTLAAMLVASIAGVGCLRAIRWRGNQGDAVPSALTPSS